MIKNMESDGVSKSIDSISIYAETDCLESLGWQFDKDGNRVYCAGNVVICSKGKKDIPVIDTISKKYIFEYYEDMSLRECAYEALKLISLNQEYSSVAFMAGILGIMRSMFIDADINIPCAVYIYGNSQKMKKTTTVKLAAMMYNRSHLSTNGHTGITRVNTSSYKADELLEECKDTAFIYDDLFRSDKREESKNARSAREIIRNFADNSPKQTKNSSFMINAQVIITAEYAIPYKSDFGRCFAVEARSVPNKNALSECQNKPLALSTCYFHYIRFLCENYEDIVSQLKEEYISRRENECECNYQRLQEMSIILRLAAQVFFYWCENCVNLPEQSIKDCHTLLLRNLRDAIDRHLCTLDFLEDMEKKEENYAMIVVNSYQNGVLMKYNAIKREHLIVKKHSILVTLTHLMRVLREEYGIVVSAKALSNYFASKGISARSSDMRNVVKYGKKGRRYLNLDIDALLYESNSLRSEIINSFSHTPFKI